jgi:hypothetical protein
MTGISMTRARTQSERSAEFAQADAVVTYPLLMD